MAFGNLANGGLADVFGAPPILTVAGGGFLAVVVVSVVWPTWRRVYGARAAVASPAV
jgi:uncharacterized membrane protein YccC